MAAHPNSIVKKKGQQQKGELNTLPIAENQNTRGGIGLISPFMETRAQIMYSRSLPPSPPDLKDFKNRIDNRAGILFSGTSPKEQAYIEDSPPRHDKYQEFILKDDIREQDILCGRGAGANTHTGNVKFRSLVGDYQKVYLSSKPLHKSFIAEEIMTKIINNGGRFLKRAEPKSSDLWYAIDHKTAKEKTCQALRERAQSTFTLPIMEMSITISKNFAKNYPIVLTDGTDVNDQDVLFGRGGVTNSHPGNRNYRSMVRNLQREYLDAPKLKKAAVAMRVVEQVYSQGGKFLVEDDGEWIEVEKEKAREKTSQALREKAPQLRQVYKAAELIQAVRKDSVVKLDHQKPG